MNENSAAGSSTRRSQANPNRPTKVQLTDIEADDTIQPRSKMSYDAIKRYTRIYRTTPNELPPITLARFRRGRLFLVDGFHRVAAAQAAHLRSLPAHISEMDRTTARWEAVKANIRHGVPLGRRDRREIFRRFVDAGLNREADGKAMSSRSLERALPVATYKTMLDWMWQDYPAIHAEMVKGTHEEPQQDEIEDTDWEQEFLAQIEFTRRNFLVTVEKAKKHVNVDTLKGELGSIMPDVEAALGFPLVTLDDVLHADRRAAADDF